MPPWIIFGHAETYEDVAFLSDGAISQLHIVMNREEAALRAFEIDRDARDPLRGRDAIVPGCAYFRGSPREPGCPA
ncbi:hypothetical protein Q4577_04175 [Marinovum sp. 2_MG-2023]|uniref:hypothetical protein n=1 Tax=unclassified Marinovum TaxID=2647166 RepID=UPI0026E3B75A|nr:MULTISPECIES: hypothetical protein [unclassified Marinovum]MDO6729202.1 hypothetical protein [Marinovum sp. 2_MG-2023]MDO6779171.1 hypothetical protein [Marinovum sp. 1_MG-2023]